MTDLTPPLHQITPTPTPSLSNKSLDWISNPTTKIPFITVFVSIQGPRRAIKSGGANLKGVSLQYSV